MVNFNDGMQRINDKFNTLNELSAKYNDYKVMPTSSIVFGEANTAEDETKAKQITRKYNIFLTIFVVVFAITTVLTVMADTSIIVKILMIAITVLAACLLIKSIFTKPKVAYGIAVYKDTHLLNSGASRNRRYMYYITFVPDNGEKILYRNIQISEKDYIQVQEGAKVMVVNKGPKACIL